MTKRKLAAAIALREGKKSQARIGDIMEVLTVMEQLMAEEALADDVLYLQGSAEVAMTERVMKLALKLKKKTK